MFGKKLKLRCLIDKHQQKIISCPNQQSQTNDKEVANSKECVACLDITTQSFEYLLCGYIRCHVRTDRVCDDIMRLCLRFYNTGFANLKFNLFNLKHSCVFYDEIMRASLHSDISCHRVFSSSIGYKIGVHKWRIQYVVADDRSLTAPSGAVGIVSQNTILSSANALGNHNESNYKALQWLNSKSFGHSIYFDQATKSVYQYSMGKGKLLKRSNLCFKVRDVITIILDCNRWTLKLMINDENIFTKNEEITIGKTHITYYPVVAFYHPGDTFRVLRT